MKWANSCERAQGLRTGKRQGDTATTPSIFRKSQQSEVCCCGPRLTPLAVGTLVSFGLAVLPVGHGGRLRGGAGATTVFLFYGG